MGVGATDEVMGVLGPCFNLDGAPISEQKVGLMDEYQLWCYVCDPFASTFRNKFVFENEGGLFQLTTDMISHFVPESEDGYESTRVKVREDFEVSHLLIYYCCVCYINLTI